MTLRMTPTRAFGAALGAAALALLAAAPAQAQTRDPYLWPFSADSIWNKPLGSGAQYHQINLPAPSNQRTDWEYLSRTVSSDPKRQEVYVTPTQTFYLDLFVKDNDPVFTQAGDDRSTNGVLAVVQPDNTIYQVAGERPTAGGNIFGTPAGWPGFNPFAFTDLFGTGYYGAHYGAALSVFGGSIRAWELASGDEYAIQHAVKIELDQNELWKAPDPTKSYVWPALNADNFTGGYGVAKNDPLLAMGSLLALRPEVTPESLGIRTLQGRKLFHAFQDYGGYIVDTAGIGFGAPNYIVSLCEERSGREVFDMDTKGDFFSDEVAIVQNLYSISNNGPNSIGGGGNPRRSGPPPFGTVGDGTTGGTVTPPVITPGGGGGLGTGFEGGDLQPTWNNSPDNDYFNPNPNSVSGFIPSVGPECGIRSSGDQPGINANNGSQMLLVTGTANGGNAFCYFKVFDLSGAPVTLQNGAALNYAINPVQDNGRYVSVDFHCTDGTTLRDSGITDSSGRGLHPNAGHGGGIPLNSWTQINANLSALAGKTVDRIWVGYDRPNSSGQFRTYIDDLSLTSGGAAAAVRLNLSAARPLAAAAPTKTVVVTCKTPGATLRYTLDGSTPTAGSAVYSKPVTMAANTTIKAIGLKNGMKASAVSAYTFTSGVSVTYTKLSGAVIGTAGSWANSGNTIAKAFDSSLNTYFDGPVPNGCWAGLDLGAGKAKKITRILYAPRPSWAARMNGGQFQGSNDNANWTTLTTVSGTPVTGALSSTTAIGSAAAFRYVRYLGPTGSYGDVTEVEFDTSP